MFTDLLEPDYGENQSPPDDTHISTTLLYYSDEELEEFKKLCKSLMKHYYPTTYMEANISDLLLKMLRDADAKTKTTPN